MSFGRVIFNFNHLHGHYVGLYPPFFFPIQGLKRKKRPFQRALKTFAKEQFMKTFFGALGGILNPKN